MGSGGAPVLDSATSGGTSTSGEPADATAVPSATGSDGLVDDGTSSSSSGEVASSGEAGAGEEEGSTGPAGPLELERCAMPNMAIPDDDPMGVTSVIDVPEMGTITEVRVQVQATHTFVGDLRVILEGNAGEVTVIDRPDDDDYPSDGNCGGHDVDALLYDDATLTVDGVCLDQAAGVMGDVRPDHPLGPVFEGQPLAGAWRLTVIDDAGNDTGSLQSWCLRITHQ